MKKANTIILIPHYNHSILIAAVIAQVKTLSLPILVVDDGSNSADKIRLEKLADEQVFIHYCAQNGGKGAAVKIGIKLAFEMGYEYAIQLDADGQHNLADIQSFIKASKQYPKSIICGKPIYDSNAPKSRLYGRKITDFWNMINTLSFDIKDGMCGFRLYPLHSINKLISQERLGNRMDFDIEILVKAHWYNIPFYWIDTPVIYNDNGVSHFRGLKDNWLISKMHARLFVNMLLRVLTRKTI